MIEAKVRLPELSASQVRQLITLLERDRTPMGFDIGRGRSNLEVILEDALAKARIDSEPMEYNARVKIGYSEYARVGAEPRPWVRVTCNGPDSDPVAFSWDEISRKGGSGSGWWRFF